MKIEVPDSIIQGMKIPPPEVGNRLLQELAVALYAQEILSFGKSRELAGLDPDSFAVLLKTHHVPRHYHEEDMDQDLKYGNG